MTGQQSIDKEFHFFFQQETRRQKMTSHANYAEHLKRQFLRFWQQSIIVAKAKQINKPTEKVDSHWIFVRRNTKGLQLHWHQRALSVCLSVFYFLSNDKCRDAVGTVSTWLVCSASCLCVVVFCYRPSCHTLIESQFQRNIIMNELSLSLSLLVTSLIIERRSVKTTPDWIKRETLDLSVEQVTLKNYENTPDQDRRWWWWWWCRKNRVRISLGATFLFRTEKRKPRWGKGGSAGRRGGGGGFR